jgi:hypothetical protein
MPLPSNAFQQVQTYQRSALAKLENLNVFMNIANTKFKNFEKLTANLGDTVTFDLPPRYTVSDSLIATFQPTVQRVQALTVNMAKNVAIDFSAQQFIFNAEKYMKDFGNAAIAELATAVEADVGSVIPSHTYRFYGNGTTAINSYGQLADMIAYFHNYGAAKHELRGILPDTKIASVINSGLSQFVIDRNEEDARDWMIGTFSGCEWHKSNLLPIHTSGTLGIAGTTLTVVSTNDPTGLNITQITVSTGGGADANAIKQDDLLYFLDGVGGQPNLRYLTFIGHYPSDNPVQIRSTADAATAGNGQVTINIYPGLCCQPTQNQNIANNIVAGMQLKAINSHRVGLLYSGDSLYLAMPQLPEEVPFPTSSEHDPDTGVSLRMYYGSRFGENQRGMVHDVIWGKTLVDEYAMRICFPV